MHLHRQQHQLVLTPDLEEYARRKLHFSLGRFRNRARSATVQLGDLDGPNGGIDTECRLEVQTSWNTEIRLEERGGNQFEVVARAAERAGRAVSRPTGLPYAKRVARGPSCSLGS